MSNVTFHLFDSTKMYSAEYCKAWYFKCKQDSGTINNLIQQEEYNDLISEYSSYLTQWDQDYEKDKFDWSEDDWNNFYKTTMKEDYDDGTNKAKNTKVKTSGLGGFGEGEEKTVDEVKEDNEKTNSWQQPVTAGVEVAGVAGAAATGVVAAADAAAAVAEGTEAAEAAVNPAAKASAIVACSVSLAIGVLYLATKPNVDAGKALEQLNALFKDTEQGNLKTSQTELENLGGECVSQAENAESAQSKMQDALSGAQSEYENKQNELEKKQKSYEIAVAVMEEIKASVASGEPLSPVDEVKFAEAQAQVASIGKEVQALSAEVETLKENMSIANEEFEATKEDTNQAVEETQSTFDDKMDDAARIKGETDYAATFDDATKGSAGLQLGLQSANAALGLYGAIRALATPGLFSKIVTAAFAAMGFAGAAASGVGIVQQAKVIGQAKDEISTRGNTENIIVETENVCETNMTLKNMANDDINTFVIDGIEETSDWTLDYSWYDESIANEELQTTPQVSGGGSVNEVIVDQQDPNKKNLEEV